ncbi:3-hydroxyacyl-CoA dehydrogenase family protein [Symbioplanes lichenis]|uniref:3-hydroxyacyl-CoA dehydrogenase family protein n=1 Tax=Symbioplanes lichenis TaxID=1629072 RepID=UPI0027399232|nr:3-hydroxyacyl-CoA dehydrogenase family protein [Actinoplanes lichenis]
MRIGVVGAGTMGVGVAQCAYQAGHAVVVTDTDPAALDGAPARLRDGIRLSRVLGRTELAPAGGALVPVTWSGDPAALARAEFVIECVTERIAVKQEVLGVLDRFCAPETVFASCTSGIPVGRLGSFTGRPDRVLGTHFMNPAPLKDTVEVVRGARTGDDTMRRALDLLTGMGKRAVVVNDGPGFVSNRILMLTINEAATVVRQDTADASTVDAVFTQCFGHPLGPLATADLIGVDTVVDTLDMLREHTGDDRFIPSALLVDLVEAGRLGRKTGHGFHRYPHAGPGR